MPVHYSDRSGTTGAIDAFAIAVPYNKDRKFLRITNPNTNTGNLYVWDKQGAATKAGAYTLVPGEKVWYDKEVPAEDIYVAGSVANMPYTGCEG